MKAEIKLNKIQEIIDLSIGGKRDNEISLKTGVTLSQVASIRKFYGILRAGRINIFRKWKKVYGNRNVAFGVTSILIELGLNPGENQYEFKGISKDIKDKTITLKFRKMEV